MSGLDNTIIIKVGRKLNIVLSGKTRRAVTVSDMQYLASKGSHIAIIEHIYEDEQSEVRDFILNFVSDTNKVYFYVPDNDDITCGIADELNYDIYMRAEDVYEVIHSDFGINVNPSLELRKKLNDSDNDEIFGTIEGLEGDSETGVESGVEPGVDEEAETETSESVETEEATSNEVGGKTEQEEGKDEQDKTANESEKQGSNKTQHTGGVVTKEEYDKVRATLVKALAAVNQYKIKLGKAEEIEQALRSEASDIKANYARLLSSGKVLEDPISMPEYKGILDQIEEHKQLEDSLRHEIDEAKTETTRIQEKLDRKDVELREVEAQVKQALSEKESLEDRIARGEISSEELEAAKVKCSELEEQLATLKRSYDNSQNMIDEYQTTQEALNKRIDMEVLTRIAMMEMFNSSLTELSAADIRENELNLTVSRLNQELSSAKKEITVSRAEIERLRVVEQAKIALESASNTLKEQLENKEEQYNNLLKSTSMDENGSARLAEVNKTLEKLNNDMKEQLSNTKRVLDRTLKERNQAIQDAKVLQEQNNTLNSRVSALSGGAAGGASIKPIKYSGNGKVIPVFGCGSYGITTSAVSIAYRLASQNRVLLIDFDIANPKMDAWMRTAPIIEGVPGVNRGYNTGLGIFVDKQLQYFMQYYEKIIKSPIRSKGGSIDYLGGFYNQLDTVKVMTANYSGLLDYLGGIYNYIVIDFGRYGASDVLNQILGYMIDISYKSVAVTTSDKFDIRNFKMKMSSNSVNFKKVFWLINLCRQTKIEDAAKQYLNGMEYSLIPFDENIYGSRIDFSRGSKITRDKLDAFLDLAILK